MIVVLLLSAAIVLSASVLGLAHIVAAQRGAAPSRELTYAVHLLDKALAADSIIPTMPADLRDQISAFVKRHHDQYLS